MDKNIKLSVVVKNDSGDDVSILLLCMKTGPVWQNKYLAKGVEVTFTWEQKYSYIWKEYGADNNAQELKPLESFKENSITLDYDESHQTFLFKDYEVQDPISGPPLKDSAGYFMVMTNKIPAKLAIAGIAIDDHAAYVMDAGPGDSMNGGVLIKEPTDYFIAYSTKKVTDTSHDASFFDSLEMVHLDFPKNIYSLTATLNKDKKWDIVNTPPKVK